MSINDNCYTATWKNGEYHCDGTGWLSEDGNVWYHHSGDPVESEQFDLAIITLVGGPAAAETLQ